MKKDMREEGEMKEDKTLSFKTQLIGFACFLVFIIALPVLFIEVQRPWDALKELIKRANVTLVQTEMFVDKKDLNQMSISALKYHDKIKGMNQQYFAWSFAMKIKEGRLLTEAEVEDILKKNRPDINAFDYNAIKEGYAFWEKELSPDEQALFSRYKDLFMKVRGVDSQAGFIFQDIYIMIDPEDRENLLFLIDGSEWFNSTFPGYQYNLAESNSLDYYDYRRNGFGFYHNSLHDRFWIFPKLEADEWGTWFSAWIWKPADMNYTVSLDFDASFVKRLMWRVGLSIFLVFLAVFIIIFFVSRYIINAIMVPIENLKQGATNVMNDKLDEEVQKVGSREHHWLIEVFNKMLRWLKERSNMMKVMKALVPKEVVAYIFEFGDLPQGLKNVGIAFVDLVKSSVYSQECEEANNPTAFVTLINMYHTIVLGVMDKYQGWKACTMGDGLLIVFNSPTDVADYEKKTFLFAIEVQQTIAAINQARLKQGLPILKLRIGVNIDRVLVAKLGAPDNYAYTIVGDAVNLGARLESNCKPDHVLASEQACELVQGVFFKGAKMANETKEIEVKNYKKPVPCRDIFVG